MFKGLRSQLVIVYSLQIYLPKILLLIALREICLFIFLKFSYSVLMSITLHTGFEIPKKFAIPYMSSLIVCPITIFYLSPK